MTNRAMVCAAMALITCAASSAQSQQWGGGGPGVSPGQQHVSHRAHPTVVVNGGGSWTSVPSVWGGSPPASQLRMRSQQAQLSAAVGERAWAAAPTPVWSAPVVPGDGTRGAHPRPYWPTATVTTVVIVEPMSTRDAYLARRTRP